MVFERLGTAPDFKAHELGGDDGSVLYFSASSAIYRIRLTTRGR